jgi:hypothetical protein
MDNQPTGAKKEETIIVWVPLLKTTMEIKEKNFNSDWMVKIATLLPD